MRHCTVTTGHLKHSGTDVLYSIRQPSRWPTDRGHSCRRQTEGHVVRDPGLKPATQAAVPQGPALAVGLPPGHVRGCGGRVVSSPPGSCLAGGGGIVPATAPLGLGLGPGLVRTLRTGAEPPVPWPGRRVPVPSTPLPHLRQPKRRRIINIYNRRQNSLL